MIQSTIYLTHEQQHSLHFKSCRGKAFSWIFVQLIVCPGWLEMRCIVLQFLFLTFSLLSAYFLLYFLFQFPIIDTLYSINEQLFTNERHENFVKFFYSNFHSLFTQSTHIEKRQHRNVFKQSTFAFPYCTIIIECLLGREKRCSKKNI